jgi:hypothetical protein
MGDPISRPRDLCRDFITGVVCGEDFEFTVGEEQLETVG